MFNKQGDSCKGHEKETEDSPDFNEEKRHQLVLFGVLANSFVHDLKYLKRTDSNTQFRPEL